MLMSPESIALLARMFDPMDRFICAPLKACQEHTSDRWTPFITAALEGKVGVLRYLASRDDVNAHARNHNGNNAYAHVLNWIHERLEWYEKDECEYPDPEIFDEVRPGETYALASLLGHRGWLG